MTYPYAPAPEAPAPAPPRRPGWVVPLVAALAVLALAAGGVAAWALMRGPSTPATTAVPTSGATHVIDGSLRLDGVVGPGWTTGTECRGRGGYADIHGGTQVTVTDRAGAVLAIGQLTDGVVAKHPQLEGAKTCLFGFTVPRVPAGADIYGIEVSHRGVIHKAEADLALSVELTLG